jgi:hypothetical protein
LNETNKRLFEALKQILDLPENVTYLSLTLEMDRHPELIINRLVDNVTIEEDFIIRLPKFERLKIGLEEGIEHARNA